MTTKQVPTAHSLFSASGAARWTQCPGSLALTQGMKSTSGVAARRGTAAHDVAAEILEHVADTTDAYYYAFGQTVTVEGDEIEIDEDLATQISKYAEYVRGFTGIRLIEVKSLYAKALGLDEDEAWGTSDAVIVAPDGTVHVMDLKTGRRWVQAEGNKQLLLYAAGVLVTLDELGIDYKHVVLHIIQPTVHAEPSIWELTTDEFREQIEAIKERAQMASEALFSFDISNPDWVDRYLFPEESACEWCPAAGAGCPALDAIVDNDVPGAGSNEFDTAQHVELLDNESLNEAMTRLPLIDIWAKGVAAEMHKRATRGDEGLSHKLVLGREGNRRFDNEDKALAALRDAGVSDEALLTEPSLRTPPQIEKELKKAKRKDLIDLLPQFIVRNPGKPTLVPAGDPRPAWSEAAVEDEFGIVEKSA